MLETFSASLKRMLVPVLYTSASFGPLRAFLSLAVLDVGLKLHLLCGYAGRRRVQGVRVKRLLHATNVGG